mmetsp:Transcript_10565/g.43758  ORF Transcript_10565/g.43758 Transcript_10565/m.43758 type:complete len:254 (-) Transcript_10565:624-1385(-)
MAGCFCTFHRVRKVRDRPAGAGERPVPGVLPARAAGLRDFDFDVPALNHLRGWSDGGEQERLVVGWRRTRSRFAGLVHGQDATRDAHFQPEGARQPAAQHSSHGHRTLRPAGSVSRQPRRRRGVFHGSMSGGRRHHHAVFLQRRVREAKTVPRGRFGAHEPGDHRDSVLDPTAAVRAALLRQPAGQQGADRARDKRGEIHHVAGVHRAGERRQVPRHRRAFLVGPRARGVDILPVHRRAVFLRVGRRHGLGPG